MIRFREFLAGTILLKSTVIAKNVRSFFKINCPFESKHDRTQHLFSMIREMTVISKVNRGPLIYSSRSVRHHHIERKAINFRKENHQSSRRESQSSSQRESQSSSQRESQSSFRSDSPSSFRKDSQSIISKRQCGIISKR